MRDLQLCDPDENYVRLDSQTFEMLFSKIDHLISAQRHKLQVGLGMHQFRTCRRCNARPPSTTSHTFRIVCVFQFFHENNNCSLFYNFT